MPRLRYMAGPGWATSKEGYLGRDIADTNERAAHAEARAAEANLELARLTTPRVLDAGAQARVLAQLRPFSGTPFDLSVAADSETLRLLSELDDVLNKAGWVQRPYPGPIGLSLPHGMVGIAVATGIHIEVPPTNQNDWTHAAQALEAALNAKGLQATATLTTSPSNRLNIKVGKKT